MRRLASFLGRAAAVVVTGALALQAAGALPSVRFTRERITVTVRPRSLEVDGLYVYENPWPVARAQGLVVPFVTGAGQEAPVAVGAALVDPETGLESEVPVMRLLGAERLTVTVPARGRALVRVRFEQRATGGRATYLLTTTRPWLLPLERGEYVLRAAPGVRVTGSSYALEGGADPSLLGAPVEAALPDERSFARRDFMPEADWTVSWEACAVGEAAGARVAASDPRERP